jgi:cytochrome c oxidase cbb3-type subunit 3
VTYSWSVFVIAIVAINIVGCAWLLWWTARRRGSEAGAPQTTGHVWDGDLTEYNKPLPRWWINLFWLTIVFGLAYLAWYPGLGNFAGKGQWSSRAEHDADRAQADKQLAARFAALSGQPLDAIARDAQAVDTGRRVFLHNCAMCHGSDARGGKGYPNLADDNWQWGGKPEDVLASVLDGRHAQMPALAGVLGSDTSITAVTGYVQQLSGQPVSQAVARPGREPFEALCGACHGKDGRGNPQIGAPNLTDDYWLYGSTPADIQDAIRRGHAGQMPAHRAILGPVRARLAAAYVWSLSRPAEAGGGR